MPSDPTHVVTVEFEVYAESAADAAARIRPYVRDTLVNGVRITAVRDWDGEPEEWAP